jgi:hypothetical protein
MRTFRRCFGIQRKIFGQNCAEKTKVTSSPAMKKKISNLPNNGDSEMKPSGSPQPSSRDAAVEPHELAALMSPSQMDVFLDELIGKGRLRSASPSSPNPPPTS